MKCKVINTINRHGMLPQGSSVLVALSGGADSMTLLCILNDLKESLGITLSAAHVNHGIRGAAADADEAFVRAECKKLGVPLQVLNADVPKLAAQRSEGLEECGRRVRYEFFDSLNTDIIATAHNADDRAETMLFNFARGATIRGLCSLKPVRGNIVRPLIECSKAEILAYCADNSINYVTDETNSDIAYSRNRIRLNVIPQLRAVNPGFDKSAARCLQSLYDDDCLLEELAANLITSAKSQAGYSATALLEAHPALCRRAVSRIIENECGITLDYDAVERVCSLLKSGGRLQLPGGAFVRVRRGNLEFPPEGSASLPCAQLFDGHNDFDGFFADMQIINSSEINNLQNCGNYLLECFADYDKICGKVYLRGRNEGDSITLKSRGITKSLKKLFNERGIAPEKRSEVAVIADEGGVVFVEGFGCNARCCITESTKRILHITIGRM